MTRKLEEGNVKGYIQSLEKAVEAELMRLHAGKENYINFDPINRILSKVTKLSKEFIY